jgi:hypothetical protein
MPGRALGQTFQDNRRILIDGEQLSTNTAMAGDEAHSAVEMRQGR